jgi:hypothetical protein
VGTSIGFSVTAPPDGDLKLPKEIMRRSNQPWTDADDDRLRTLVRQGSSVIRAAAALHRTTASVRFRARAIGCPFPALRVARQKWADTPDHI